MNSPACLTSISECKPPGHVKTLLDVESEIEYSKNFNKKLVIKKKKINKEFYEIASEASDDVAGSSNIVAIKLAVLNDNDIKVNGREEFPERKNTILSSNNNNEDNHNVSDDNNNSKNVQNETKFSTLPKAKQRGSIAIPQRITADGTKIFYICDLPKKIRKGFFDFIKLFRVD